MIAAIVESMQEYPPIETLTALASVIRLDKDLSSTTACGYTCMRSMVSEVFVRLEPLDSLDAQGHHICNSIEELIWLQVKCVIWADSLSKKPFYHGHVVVHCRM